MTSADDPSRHPARVHPDETFRRTLTLRTPDREPARLIVVRRGGGRDMRVWLTFEGLRYQSAVVLSREEAAVLVIQLDKARAG